MARKRTLLERYPPSPPCSCDICSSYCKRPGWWMVKEAAKAIDAGYANRMMLELSPDRTFGVLSPAFSGCEGNFALNQFAVRGCNFLQEGLCILHGTEFQPLECRFCHHDRVGLGSKCHADLEADWRMPAGRALVTRWGQITGIWERIQWMQTGIRL